MLSAAANAALICSINGRMIIGLKPACSTHHRRCCCCCCCLLQYDRVIVGDVLPPPGYALPLLVVITALIGALDGISIGAVYGEGQQQRQQRQQQQQLITDLACRLLCNQCMHGTSLDQLRGALQPAHRVQQHSTLGAWYCTLLPACAKHTAAKDTAPPC
jgi:hypothetical protein